jgi:hypothetical protein
MLPLINLLPFHMARQQVTMKRISNNERYCISHVYVGSEDEYFCDAIEDTVRDVNHNGVFDNGEQKVNEGTAIPCGRYYVAFRKTGLPIGAKARYGSIPLLHNVPHFTLIRIHNGETEQNSAGCIILGLNKEKGRVVDSEATCLRFYERLRYRPFWLEIKDCFAD